MIRRSKGIVIARTGENERKFVWKVRIQDTLDPRNNMEFPIASVHNEITLAEGLNVDFLIGRVDDPEGQKVEKAIDVRPIESPLSLETIEQREKELEERERKEHSVLWSIVERVNREFAGQDPSPIKQDSLSGRGGQRHRYLQQFVKRLAEEKGYRAIIEKQISGNGLSIDVALEKGGLAIACEIAITNIYGEPEKIKKCLEAGYHYVISISTERSILNGIEKRVSAKLSGNDMQRVQFFLPEEFLSFLEWLESQLPTTESTCKGYKVKVRYVPVEPEEAEAKRKAVNMVIAGSIMRQLKSTANNQS